MSRSRHIGITAAIAALIVLAACAGAQTASSQAAGTEAVWVNDDEFAHTITHGTDGDAVDGPFVDEHIDGGGEVRVVFDEARTFPITCEIHPSMQMEITVEG